MDKKHILVVDDDQGIRNLLQKYLVDQGYLVSNVKDTKEARVLLHDVKCQLIILDLMMPGESGIEFAKYLRIEQKNFIPIIMLTAMGEIEDKIHGLEIGADDYLVKPFEPKELLLRIANIFKRTQDKLEVIYFGDLSYNIAKQSLIKQGVQIFLTSGEHNLLSFLLKSSDKVVTREELAVELGINERSVDVQIVRLRNKIETNPSRPILLQTIRGQGYSIKQSS